MCFLMYFTEAALFLLCLAACSRIRFQDFLFLVQLASIHIPPPHALTVLAMQLFMAAKHRCRRQCGRRLPLASHILAQHHFHLLNRLVFLLGVNVSSALQWLMAKLN